MPLSHLEMIKSKMLSHWLISDLFGGTPMDVFKVHFKGYKMHLYVFDICLHLHWRLSLYLWVDGHSCLCSHGCS